MHTIETMQKTHESYMAAFTRLASMFKDIRLHGCGYSYRIGEDFDAVGDIENANECTVKIAELFECGKPQLVEPTWWIARSSFFELAFRRREAFQIFHYEHGHRTLNEEGETVQYEPAKIVGDEQSLRFHFGKCGFGLNGWQDNKAKIFALAERCVPEVKEYILNQIDSADKRAAEWKEAMSKLNGQIAV